MYKIFFDEVNRHLKEKVDRIVKLNDPETKKRLGTDTAQMTAILAEELYGKMSKELGAFIQKIMGSSEPVVCNINYTSRRQTISFSDAEGKDINVADYTNHSLESIIMRVFRKLVYQEEFFPIIEAFINDTTNGYANDSKFTINDICKKFETAIATAVANEIMHPLYKDHIKCEIDADARTVRLFVLKDVVELEEDVFDPDIEIWVEDAQSYRNGALVGEQIEHDLDITEYGRVVAQTVKHVFRQGVSELTKEMVFKELQAKEKEIISAKYVSHYNDTGAATLRIGNLDVYLPASEQIPGETFIPDQTVQAYLVEVSASTGKSARVKISRTHHGFVKRLFENEVTEISEGIVEIKSIAREAGVRTKIAVYSKDPDIDPVGACIGPKGARVNAIIKQLSGEKIDVIKYSEDPTEYISAALAPAEVRYVQVLDSSNDEQLAKFKQKMDAESAEAGVANAQANSEQAAKPGQEKLIKACEVCVPDDQLSLAIGNRGINAKLAAKLTGWKIDIKPESTFVYKLSSESSDEK